LWFACFGLTSPHRVHGIVAHEHGGRRCISRDCPMRDDQSDRSRADCAEASPLGGARPRRLERKRVDEERARVDELQAARRSSIGGQP
jgi:hypothetical protein